MPDSVVGRAHPLAGHPPGPAFDLVRNGVSETLWLQPNATAPRRARHWLAEWCAEWGCEELVEDAALLISELITNAALHARTTITVSARMVGDELKVAVADRQPGRVGHVMPGTSAEGGRGLPIVAAVADDWGVQSHPGGKFVWFTLTADRPAHRGLALTGPDV